jgi:hypothetical protein
MLIANLQSLFLQIGYATLVALLLLTFSPRPVGAIAAYLYLSARTIARAVGALSIRMFGVHNRVLHRLS